MAKSFVICHSEETVERGSHCAHSSHLCACTFVSTGSFVFPLLCLSPLPPAPLPPPLTFPSVDNAASAASCALFAVRHSCHYRRPANIIGQLERTSYPAGGSILITIECTDGLKNACLRKCLHDVDPPRCCTVQWAWFNCDLKSSR